MKIKLAFRFHNINVLAVFFPWFAPNFYFLLIQTLYQTSPYTKTKENKLSTFILQTQHIHQKGKVIKNPTKITKNLP